MPMFPCKFISDDIFCPFVRGKCYASANRQISLFLAYNICGTKTRRNARLCKNHFKKTIQITQTTNNNSIFFLLPSELIGIISSFLWFSDIINLMMMSKNINFAITTHYGILLDCTGYCKYHKCRMCGTNVSKLDTDTCVKHHDNLKSLMQEASLIKHTFRKCPDK